jgi:hypothetical protein
MSLRSFHGSFIESENKALFARIKSCACKFSTRSRAGCLVRLRASVINKLESREIFAPVIEEIVEVTAREYRKSVEAIR